MKYKITVETRHNEGIPPMEPIEPILIDEFTVDVLDLEDALALARKTALSFIMDPANEKTPGVVANNGYSVTFKEVEE